MQAIKRNNLQNRFVTNAYALCVLPIAKLLSCPLQPQPCAIDFNTLAMHKNGYFHTICRVDIPSNKH